MYFYFFTQLVNIMFSHLTLSTNGSLIIVMNKNIKAYCILHILQFHFKEIQMFLKRYMKAYQWATKGE